MTSDRQTSTSSILEVAERFFAAVGQDDESLRGVLAEDATLDRGPFDTTLAQLRSGRALSDPRSNLTALWDLLPGLRLTVPRRFVEGDRVASLVRVEASGARVPVDVNAVIVLWIDGGRVSRVWGVGDELRLLLQLGAAALPARVTGAADPDAAVAPWLEHPTSAADPSVLREVARKLVEGVVSTGDVELAAEVLVEDLIFSRPGLGSAFAALAMSAPTRPGRPDDFTGLEGFRHGLRAIRTAFPDWNQRVGDGQVADGDIVISPIRVAGTQRGDLFGNPPTGRRVVFDEVLMMRMRDKQIADIWAMGDEAGFLLAFDKLNVSGADV